MAEDQPERPVPEVDPRPITGAQYLAYTPEKLELYSGYLIFTADEHEERRDLLQLLLTNEGLEAAVRLAPEAHWREALERAYGSSKT